MTNTTATQANLDARYVGLKERLNAANPDDNHAVRLTAFQVVNALRAGNLRLAERQLNELETELNELAGTPSPVPAPVPGSPTTTPAPTATQPPANPPAPVQPPAPADGSQAPAWAQDLLMMTDDNNQTTTVRAIVEKNRERIWDLANHAGRTDDRLDILETDVKDLKSRKEPNPVLGGIIGLLMIAITFYVIFVVTRATDWFAALVIAFVVGAASAVIAAKLTAGKKGRKARDDQSQS